MNLTKCKNGNHQLETLFKQCGVFDETYVARWCSVCGSVVVDLEEDNIIYAGGVVKMKSPKLLAKAETEKP
jgi:hypothetical protein